MRGLLIWIFVGAAATLAGWPLVLSFAVVWAYPHRMVDIRDSEDRADWHKFASLFLKERIGSSEKPVILVIGSSVSFGYAFAPDVIYTAKLQQQFAQHRVVNASVINAGITMAVAELCEIKAAGLKVDKIVLEYQLTNIQPEISRGQPLDCQNTGLGWEAMRAPKSYFELFLFDQRGLGWVRFLYDKWGYDRQERNFSAGPVPDSYFLKAGADFIERLDRTLTPSLTVAREVANEVYVVTAPLYFDGVEKSGFSRDRVLEPYLKFLDYCRSVVGIKCLMPDPEMPGRYFSNYTHLNIAGHEYFAGWLSKQITSPVAGAANHKAARTE